jgi:hypothetical protein
VRHSRFTHSMHCLHAAKADLITAKGKAYITAGAATNNESHGRRQMLVRSGVVSQRAHGIIARTSTTAVN